jgi:hypothetical protein
MRVAQGKGKPHLPSLFGEYHADVQAGQEWKFGHREGDRGQGERAAEGLQYGEVIANEGGNRVRSSRSSLGQVWYLFAFDLVNLLASLLGLASSGGTAAAASGSDGSSTVEVRRSPKQTMHDSAML